MTAKSTRRTHPGSLALNVVVWFATNPGRSLTVKDIARLFDCNHTTVSPRLMAMVRDKYLNMKHEPSPIWGGRHNVYSIGSRTIREGNR